MYKSVVLPIITFASQCWSANRACMKSLENFQYRVLKWAAADFRKTYHELLKFFELLPLNMFLQLNDLLHLSKLLQNNNLTDCEIEVRETSQSRISDKTIKITPPRTEKSRRFLLFRASRVANLLPQDVDFFSPVGLKRRLLNFMWKQFEARFCYSNCCTWVLQCDCHNCRENWNHYV